MRTLIVTAHPDHRSHAHAVVEQLVKGISSSGLHSVEIALGGYFSSTRNQIDGGIFGYCGVPEITSELLLPSDEGYPDAHYAFARLLGQRLFTLKESA